MVVSYTFTIESTGGNGIVVPGWGFLLNNELTDFNIDDPEHPNAPEGGKRPRSSIAPTYVERDRRPFLAVGSPGGATIITTVLQILTERIDFGRSLPQAIADPRASQRNAATTAAEQAFVDALRRRRSAPGATRSACRRRSAPRPGSSSCPGGRFLAAAEPVRRGGGCGAGGAAPLAGRPVREHRQHGAGVVHDGVRAGQRLGAERAGGDRDHADAVDARAGDVARRVPDHHGARSRAQPPARSRAIAGSRPRSSASEPKPPWPGSK